MSAAPWRALPALALLAAAAPALAAPRALDPARRFGIRPVALRTTGGGWMLDLRYRVVDAARARPLFDARLKPRVVDRRSGAALRMPEDTKLGALRSSPRARVEAGRVYYVLFRNPGQAIGRGAHVDVDLGAGCVLRDLVVE